MKNGINAKYKKGTFLKIHNVVFMVIGFVENEGNIPLASLIRIKQKNGRFNIKHKYSIHRDNLDLFEEVKDVNIDSRDEEILKEFVEYINSFELKIKKGDKYRPWIVRILNANFSKFKKYSNNI